MNRLKPMQPINSFSMAVGAIALAACVTAGAQTAANPARKAATRGRANATTSAGSSNNAPAQDSRAPVAAQGVGTFVGGGWTVTAYGCFRAGTRLFCDFDMANRRNLQAGSNIWHTVKLLDDGGKLTNRHNAFFVGDDGSQFPHAYLGPTPARFIMEYDDVDQRYTSVSLVNGRDRIQAVPITPIDPSQPAGTIPARASANAAAGTKGEAR